MGFFDFLKSKKAYEGEVIGIEKDDVEKAYNSTAVTSIPVGSKVSLFPTKIIDATSNACLTLISDTLTASHLFVEEQVGEEWQKVNSNNVLQLSIDRPSPKVSQTEFLSMIAQSMQVYNVAYVGKEKIGGKVYMEAIKPDCAEFTHGDDGEVTSIEYGKKVYQKDDIIIIRRPTILTNAASPWEIATKYVNAANDAQESTDALSKSQGIFTGIITPNGANLSKEAFESFKRDIKKVKDKKSGLLITNHGIDFHPLAEPPASQDELVNSYNKQKALSFRVPPTLLGDLENATYNNVQTTEIFFWNHTIRPLMTFIEEAFTLDLENRKLRYRFDVSKVDALVVNFTNRLKAAKESPTGIPFDQLNEKLSLGFAEFSRSDESLQPAGLVPAQELGGDDF